MLRLATTKDAKEICAIYNPYIRETICTFEVTDVDSREMARRIDNVLRTGLPWLVREDDTGTVVGYAYATLWRSRPAYRYSVESTIYLGRHAREKGVGKALYGALMKRLSELGVHTAIGGIALPNAASVALHEGLGFRKVAHFEAVGRKFDHWIDVGYWQLIFER